MVDSDESYNQNKSWTTKIEIDKIFTNEISKSALKFLNPLQITPGYNLSSTSFNALGINIFLNAFGGSSSSRSFDISISMFLLMAWLSECFNIDALKSKPLNGMLCRITNLQTTIIFRLLLFSQSRDWSLSLILFYSLTYQNRLW